MRDWVLLGGFALCVVIGAVTVLWPQLSTSEPEAGASSAPQSPSKPAAKK